MAKFPVKKYAQLEINRAAFLKTGMVGSQLPLSDEFTEENPCENGMWVDASRANGEYKMISDATEHVGIVYTTEKEWGKYLYGLKNYAAVGGVYPRIGELHYGDVFTTNCFDMGSFTEESLKTALVPETLAATPLYVVAVAGQGRPQVTATKPTDGFFGRVIKQFTMPNGEFAIKYHMEKA